MYEVLIFLVFIFPFAYKKCLKRNNKDLTFRVINILISLLLFLVFLSEFRNYLWLLYQRGFEAFFSYRLPKEDLSTDVKIINVLYALLALYVTALSIGLAVCNERTRSRFVYSIPFLWIITTLYLFIYYINSTGDKAYKGLTFMITGLLLMLVWAGIFLIYNSVKVKRLFESSPDLKGNVAT